MHQIAQTPRYQSSLSIKKELFSGKSGGNVEDVLFRNVKKTAFVWLHCQNQEFFLGPCPSYSPGFLEICLVVLE